MSERIRTEATFYTLGEGKGALSFRPPISDDQEANLSGAYPELHFIKYIDGENPENNATIVLPREAEGLTTEQVLGTMSRVIVTALQIGVDLVIVPNEHNVHAARQQPFGS